jgi:tripartite tricarboxylate transporter TctB family protein
VTALIGPVLLSLAGVAALLFAREFGLWSFGSPGAGLMPAAAGTLLLLASLADLRLAKGLHRSAFAWRPLSYMAGLAALIPLTPLLGLLPALAVLVFAILHFIERVPLGRAAVIAGATVAGSWLLFERLLSVPLPKSMFW